MPTAIAKLFILNKTQHYFEVNTQLVAVNKTALQDCQLFDNEKALLEAVCAATGCEMDEVAGSVFYITMRDGGPVMVDDRGFAYGFDVTVEDYISNFEM